MLPLVYGPVYIDQDTEFHGMITLGASVKDGALFHLYGMITGDLTVEKGREAIICGMVDGTVWNYGHVTHYGCVDSMKSCTPDCKIVIDPKATLKGGNHDG